MNEFAVIDDFDGSSDLDGHVPNGLKIPHNTQRVVNIFEDNIPEDQDFELGAWLADGMDVFNGRVQTRNVGVDTYASGTGYIPVSQYLMLRASAVTEFLGAEVAGEEAIVAALSRVKPQTIKPSNGLTYFEDVSFTPLAKDGDRARIRVGQNAFIIGDLKLDVINPGGSDIGTDYQLFTDGLFTVHFNCEYGVYNGSDLIQDDMGYTYVVQIDAAYSSSQNFLPPSLEGYGLEPYGYASALNDVPTGGLLFHYNWWAARIFIVVTNVPHFKIGSECRNKVLSAFHTYDADTPLCEVLTVGTPSPGSTPYAMEHPQGDTVGYGEVFGGQFMREGYASKIFNWYDTTIDFSSVNVPSTDGYDLRFDGACAMPASFVVGGNSSTFPTSNSQFSASRFVNIQDVPGSLVGWEVGHIKGGSSGGGGLLVYKNFYLYILQTVSFPK